MKKELRVYLLLFITFASLISHSQSRQLANTLEGIENVQAIVDNAQQRINEIDEAFAKVESSNLYKKLVDGHSVTFPFGILPDNGDKNYALVVNSVRIDAVLGMTAEIFMKIPISTDSCLYFIADRVPLSSDGTMQGDMKLYLLKTKTASFGEGFSVKFNGIGGGAYDICYVMFDCKGFKELTVNGNLEFNKEAIETHNNSGGVGEQVVLPFHLSARSLTDFVMEFHDIAPFQFAKLPGYKCSVDKIVLDLSEIKNAPGFSFPTSYNEFLTGNVTGYNQQLYEGGLWEGVFMSNLKIEMPRAFTEGSNQESLEINVDHFIVDQHGVSLLMEAIGQNSTPLVDGNIKGFEYKIDSIGFQLTANDLTSGMFSGSIVLPICDRDSELSMRIYVSNTSGDGLQYAGTASVESETNINFSAFGIAQTNIDTIRLDMDFENNQFYPKAVMNGTVNIGVPKKESDGYMGSIEFAFSEFTINSRAPFLSLGQDGYFRVNSGSNSALANLPISIKDFEAKFETNGEGERFGLGMTVVFQLQSSEGQSSSSSNGFGAEADFVIWTQQNAQSKRWAYDDYDIGRILIEVDNSAFSLRGVIETFEDDEIYGNGLCGKIDVSIIEKINIEASIIFGNKTDVQVPFRYWFVDAMVQFSPGIPLMPGSTLNSFTGGLYHHMKMVTEMPNVEKTACPTASGRTFIPNDSIFVGVLAGVGIQSTGGGKAFNGNINLGIEILSTGGIKKIATWGGVGFMSLNFTPPALADVASDMDMNPVGDNTQIAKPNIQSSLIAAWYVEFDFPNRTFSGDFDIFVDVAEVLKGRNANDHAGRISLFASPNDWYIYIGQPSSMIGVEVIRLFDIGGYVCLGTKLPTPAIAPLPASIPGFNFDIDESLLALGGGFSFGGRLSIGGDAGADADGKRLRLGFSIEAGFDILMAQSVNPVFCTNYNSQRGINGWYGTGQAFFAGQGGVYLNNTRIVGLSIYAAVFAQFPKPTYIKGIVGGEVSFLFFSGHVDFKVEIGESCSTESSLDNTVSFIDGISPADSSTNVSVYAPIEIFFSEKLEEFEYEVTQGQDDVQRYRFVLQNKENPIGHGLSVKHNGAPIEFEYTIKDDKRGIVITPKRVLPQNAPIEVTVRLVTEKEGSGGWNSIDAIETFSVTYYTGYENQTLQESNVKYAYPIPQMTNFYKEETRMGYIKLNLLPTRPVTIYNNQYSFNVAIYDGNTEITRTREVRYNADSAFFTFEMPVEFLELDTKYTLKLMKAPSLTAITDTIRDDEDERTGAVLAEAMADSVILSYDFTTSQYASFVNKMSSYSTRFSELVNGVAYSTGVSSEPFSRFETSGIVKNGAKLAKKLVVVGTDDANEILSSGAISLTEINEMNEQLRQTSLNCLIDSGNCTSDDLSGITIPAGSFVIPVKYRLPGTDEITSQYNISINIPNDIELPR